MSDIRINPKHIQETKPYYLGLDIGTNSIGYATTDSQYNLIKKAGKNLWGVHLFTEAEPAANARSFRSARRRNKRRKTRTKLLQEYFAKDIEAIDPSFFQRLKDGFFVPEDKSVKQPNTLFNDPDYMDKDYHKAYPTIYHLRLELMNSAEPHDPRQVYLACHHILQNRGHFHLKGELGSADQQMDSAVEEFKQIVEDEIPDIQLWTANDNHEISQILTDPKMNRSDKKRSISNYASDANAAAKEFASLIVGLKANFHILFKTDEYSEADISSVKFSDGNYELDDVQQSIGSLLGDRKDILDKAYAIYQATILQQLLSNPKGGRFDSISEARVETYEQHKNDLIRLKRTLKEIDNALETPHQLYDLVLRENKKGLNNYVAYSGHSDDLDVSSPEKKTDHEKFLKWLTSQLEKRAQYISDPTLLQDIEDKNFLPKISSSANGVVPMQLIGKELEQILLNASSYLSFLTEDVKSEIMEIFRFRIPYYIGPFDDRSRFAWLVRKSHEKIRPWNLEKVVDVTSTSEKFIRNMTSKCTYLYGEDVLPKESLLYSEFMVRNAINTIMVDGERLEKDVRDHIYHDLFEEPKRSGTVSKSNIIKALKAHGLIVNENNISGIDENIPAKLKAHRDFKRIVGDKLNRSEIESVIEKITVFPDEPDMICNWITSNLAEKNLTELEIKQLSALSYKDWGRLSKKLLAGIRTEDSHGNKYTIIEMMREQPVNLMEILDSNRFQFRAEIDKFNQGLIGEPNVITEELLESKYLSPAVKKAMRKTLRLCEEICSIMKGAPERIFIEMAREEGEKTRTVSRKSR